MALEHPAPEKCTTGACLLMLNRVSSVNPCSILSTYQVVPLGRFPVAPKTSSSTVAPSAAKHGKQADHLETASNSVDRFNGS
jgi:hypothetical protein